MRTRQITLIIVLLAMAAGAMAQKTNGKQKKAAPRQEIRGPHAFVTFRANSNEEFVVYVDGDIYNRKQQRNVEITNLSMQSHEFSIVLKRPTDKIVTCILQPNEFGECKVIYNRSTNNLELLTPPPANRKNPAPEQHPISAQTHIIPDPIHQEHLPAGAPQHQPMQPSVPQHQIPAGVHQINNREVDEMISTLSNETFDDTRLSTAEVMLNNKLMFAEDIIRLANTFNYDSNKLAFLKWAYKSCINKEEYYKTSQTLTFNSNKKELLDFINANQQ